MNSRFPAVNTAVTLTYQEQDYRTFVLDALPPRFVLAYPFPADVHPSPGDFLSIGFIAGAQYGCFSAVIVERQAEPVRALIVEQIGEPSFTWRRGAFRLPIRRPAEFRCQSGERYQAETVDISATGVLLRLRHDLPLAEESDVEVTIYLEETHPFRQPARIVRRVQQGNILYLALHFQYQRDAEPDQLVRWLFAKQRELRKKGLL